MPGIPPLSSILRASPELLPPPPTTSPDVAPIVEYKPGFDFKKLQEKVKNLVDSWKGEVEQARKRRLLRVMEVNNEEERRRGRFKPDEVYIPLHVIDDNINKQASSYISFVTQGRNAAIFKPQGIAAPLNLEPLERVFTTAVRYEGWEQEIFGLIDGMQLHGIDYLEVKFDADKPGSFSFEHLGYENVFYPKVVQRGKFQLSPMIVRQCSVTKEELLSFPEINVEQVEVLFKDRVEEKPEDSYVNVQKVFYRLDGIINICWMSYEKSTDFLRNPKPLFLGRRQTGVDPATGQSSSTNIYESFYPIVPFPYNITENKCLCETKGRATLDESVQEAVSSLTSSIVNGFHRASQVMWAPKNPTSSTQIEQLDLVIENGRGLSQPIDFFSMPYPNDEGINIVNALLTQKKSETSQVNFAVGNRQDYASRKTAEEIKVASQSAAKLSTTEIVLFSTSIREVMTIGFLIFKGQIEAGVIQLPDIDPQILAIKLTIQSSGEVEVIQRQETLQNLQNMWPIISQTPAAMLVLKDILKLMVPALAEKYIAALDSASPVQLVAGLAKIIAAIASEHPEVIPPESYEQLHVLMQEAQKLVEQQGITNGNTGPSQEGGGGATQNNPPQLSPPPGNQSFTPQPPGTVTR